MEKERTGGWRVGVAEAGSTGSGSVRVCLGPGIVRTRWGNKMKNGAPQCHVERINGNASFLFVFFFNM